MKRSKVYSAYALSLSMGRLASRPGDNNFIFGSRCRGYNFCRRSFLRTQRKSFHRNRAMTRGFHAS